MKSLSWKPILLLPLIMTVINCTSETADVYKSENIEFSAQTIDSESIGQAQLVEVEPGDLPEFPGKLEQVDPFTYEIVPLVDVDPADTFEETQIVSLKNPKQKPQLDLLFIIDDSRSMTEHQERLKKNMDKFVAELANSDVLDYRIGVTTTYDTGRYFHPVTEFRRTEPFGRNFERMGRLLPLKDPSNENHSQRFVTPEIDTSVLAETLKVGAQEWVKHDTYKDMASGEEVVLDGDSPQEDLEAYNTFIQNFVLISEATGPLKEELLNPMVMALFPESLVLGPSRQFYRDHFPPARAEEGIPAGIEGDAAEEAWKSFAQNYNGQFVRDGAHLGVIFVTDTVDNSNIAGGLTGEVAAMRLAQLKKDDSFERISTYGVLHKNTVSASLQTDYPNEWSRRHCSVKREHREDWRQRGCDSPSMDLDPICEKYVDDDNDVRGNKSYKNPQELEKFLNLTRGRKKPGANILNLCSGGDGTADAANNSYGKNLAKIASELFVKSVSVGSYNLKSIPTAGKIQVYFKDRAEEDPTRQLPICKDVEEGELCYVAQIRPGSKKIIIRNRQKLVENGDLAEDIVIKYRAIDPTSATLDNTVKVGK